MGEFSVSSGIFFGEARIRGLCTLPAWAVRMRQTSHQPSDSQLSAFLPSDRLLALEPGQFDAVELAAS